MTKWYGGSWIRKVKRIAIYIRDSYTCVYCNKYVSDIENIARHKNCNFPTLTLDHVIPRSEGGANDSSNLVTCCMQCNIKKANKSLDEFVEKEKAETIRNRLLEDIDLAEASNFLKVFTFFDKV